MAISNLLPRKTMPSRTRLQSMAERHNYDQNPEKTRDGELVSAYMRSPEGRHQFVVATHVDKAHIHMHIEFNSTNLDCDGKFKNVKDSVLHEN